MSLDHSVTNRLGFFKYLGYGIMLVETMVKVMQVLAVGQDQQPCRVFQPPSAQLSWPT